VPEHHTATGWSLLFQISYVLQTNRHCHQYKLTVTVTGTN